MRTETDSQRIALQSVTREALSNIAKHAAAHTVTVRLRGTARTITLEIVDDGRGFSPEAAKNKPGRLGLGGMRERVELLGGEFEVASRPGGPTNITATLKAWRAIRSRPLAPARPVSPGPPAPSRSPRSRSSISEATPTPHSGARLRWCWSASPRSTSRPAGCRT